MEEKEKLDKLRKEIEKAQLEKSRLNDRLQEQRIN